MQGKDAILKQVDQALAEAETLLAVDQVRIDYLGKQGVLTNQLKQIGSLSPEERPRAGQVINEIKKAVQERVEEKRSVFEREELRQRLSQESIDVTLSGRGSLSGSLHPITHTVSRVTELFAQLGFQVVEGPEIETEHYNFEALNMPSHHPARHMHDTFYFEGGHLLRTHTSPVQIRYMETHPPPLRLIAPGRVYRCDSDATHTPMFHQVEGLFVSESATFLDLKGVLTEFFHHFFEKKMALRFRPSYFPFTEPSAEVDIQCVSCEGKGDDCRVCKGSGWLEVLGCGMVHPNVLKSVHIDPEKYNGWAFGLGIDRLAMLHYGIDDLRVLFDNDLRFLRQFPL